MQGGEPTRAAAPATVAQLLGRVLAIAGVDAVYGKPFGDLAVVPVVDPDAAAWFAMAHKRVTGRAAAAHIGYGAFEIGDGAPDGLVVSDRAEIAEAAEVIAARAAAPAGCRFVINVDPEMPAPSVTMPRLEHVERWPEPSDDVVAGLASADTIVVLAGPGVVAEGAVAGLHALAATGSIGVLNTWGAKGVFDWRSRHHLATAGLQARDFELGGLAEADLVIATGLDEAEAPNDRWRLAPVVEVAPAALQPLAERWGRQHVDIAIPPLRSRLADVTQRGWAHTGPGPLPPTLVTSHYAAAFDVTGFVAATPGLAGYWVARTFSTTRLGSVVVPSRSDDHGVAAACVAVARLRRPSEASLLVADAPLDERVSVVIDAAASLGVPIPVELWDPAGPLLGADEHRDRLSNGMWSPAPQPVALATDPRQLDEMIEAAGPVIAWRS